MFSTVLVCPSQFVTPINSIRTKEHCPMFDSLFRSRILVRLIVLQVAAMTIYGCGPAAKPTGKITGSVKYKGQPVAAGDVNLFQKKTGAAITAPLDASGKFTVTAPMETGTYNVAITPPRPKQLPPGTAPEPMKPFPIPMKYQDPSQSTITQEVKTGDNVMDISVPD